MSLEGFANKKLGRRFQRINWIFELRKEPSLNDVVNIRSQLEVTLFQRAKASFPDADSRTTAENFSDETRGMILENPNER